MAIQEEALLAAQLKVEVCEALMLTEDRLKETAGAPIETGETLTDEEVDTPLQVNV